MRALTKNELDQASGATTCTLNPEPIAPSSRAMSIATGTLARRQMAIITGGRTTIPKAGFIGSVPE
ncbi:hypothetical protein [Burkholderia sp. YIM B11467]